MNRLCRPLTVFPKPVNRNLFEISITKKQETPDAGKSIPVLAPMLQPRSSGRFVGVLLCLAVSMNRTEIRLAAI